MKGNKAEFNISGMLIGMLVIGLFFGVISLSIESLGGSYDNTGYNSSDLTPYMKNSNLSAVIKEQADIIDDTVVDKNVFDILADLFNQLLTPFKFIYNTFKTLGSMATQAVSKLNLLPIFTEFFVTLITIIVIVGIVMIKHFFGRNT